MTRLLRHAVWFSRPVLAVGTFLFAAISMRYLVHPVAAGAAFGIIWGSPAAVTIARVGFGGFPLALAVILLACQVSGRLLVGLAVLSTTVLIITAIRVAGLILDGPAPFTLQVLRPEVALSTLSIVGVALEARRRREVVLSARITTPRAASQPQPSGQ